MVGTRKTVDDFPDVAAEWHPTRNGGVTAADLPAGSNQKAWWKCPVADDHEWEAVVASRTGKAKAGCPCCAGRKASATNSLAVQFPEVAAQWHPTRNGGITPDDVPGGSSKKHWWKCQVADDHEWEATVHSRTGTAKAGCPCCAGRKASVTNSLAMHFPAVASQWHTTRNGDVTPDQVPGGSHKTSWWKCPNGPDHEWQSTVANRTKSEHDCPFCANQKPSVTNSLGVLFPEIAAEWHPTHNADLKPESVVAGSNKKQWWKCAEGVDHEWQASPGSRIGKRKSGCPFCANQKVSVTNSLATISPEIAKQWHPTKNNSVTPDHVINGSEIKRWWKCPEGPDHEWKVAPGSRTGGKESGCPFCAGQKASVTNSLASLFPEIASEWHSVKNGKKVPDQVVAGTNKKYWWKCPAGPDHEWLTACSHRTHSKTSCPFCAGHLPSVTNSLAVLFPDIAAQWHPTKNAKKTPDQIVAGTNKKYWWKCPNGPDHEWSATAEHRTSREHGCPFCTLIPRSRIEICLCHELLSFFDFDLTAHRLNLDGKVRDVDILIPDLNLAIEFDGAYWHRDKDKQDSAKTASLVRAGWRVIRIRERPLKKVAANDIVVANNITLALLKPVVDQLLLQIEKICEITIPDKARYLRRKTLANKKAAEAYIEDLLTSKTAN